MENHEFAYVSNLAIIGNPPSIKKDEESLPRLFYVLKEIIATVSTFLRSYRLSSWSYYGYGKKDEFPGNRLPFPGNSIKGERIL